jgi:multiple sugar transport system permease protein
MDKVSSARIQKELPEVRSHRWRRKLHDTGTPYLLLSPFLILYGVFFILPLLYALYLSLFNEQLIGGTVFVGLDNYAQVFADSDFWDGLGRVFIYSIIQVPVTLIIALGLALVLDSGYVRRRSLFQLGYFLPFAIPSVISALLWGYLYGPFFGVFGQIFRAVGLPAPGFLTSSGVMPSIGNIAIWSSAGANMIILYAALRSISPELYEAATIDGASQWRIAWHIKIPLLESTLIFTAVLAIIVTLQLFNEPSILAAIVPGVVTQSFTPNLYAYTLVSTNQQYNYAAAVAFTLAVAIVICTGLLFAATRLLRRK